MLRPRWLTILAALLAAGCSESLGPPSVADHSTPESWAAQPPHLWPQIVLTNQASFHFHSPLEGASCCLLQTDDGRIVAATAKQLLGEAGGVTPEIAPAQLNGALEAWRMYPRTRPSEAVAISGLAAPGLDRPGRDLLFLRVFTSPAGLPAQPLRIRAAPVRPGETVYLLACPFSQQDRSQNVYSGQITKCDENTFTFSMNPPLEIAGLSGAPVIDAKGHALGIMTGGYVSTAGGPANAVVAESLSTLRGVLESQAPAAASGGPLASNSLAATPVAPAAPMSTTIYFVPVDSPPNYEPPPSYAPSPAGPPSFGPPGFGAAPFSPPSARAPMQPQPFGGRDMFGEMEQRRRAKQQEADRRHQEAQERMRRMQQDNQRRLDELRRRARSRR